MYFEHNGINLFLIGFTLTIRDNNVQLDHLNYNMAKIITLQTNAITYISEKRGDP